MRHPRIFSALAAVGTAIIGVPVASAVFASGYPDYRKWSQKQFQDWFPAVTEPLPLVIAAFFVVGYLAILFYCGTGKLAPPSLDELERQELDRLRAHGNAREKYAKEKLEVPKQPSDVEIGMGDTYKNSGTVFGNMGPTTNIYGKQPFQMTDAVLASVADQIGSPRQLGIYWVGSQQSHADAERLAIYLNGRGFTIDRMGGIGMLIPQLSKPIELRGDDLYVDSDK